MKIKKETKRFMKMSAQTLSSHCKKNNSGEIMKKPSILCSPVDEKNVSYTFETNLIKPPRVGKAEERCS